MKTSPEFASRLVLLLVLASLLGAFAYVALRTGPFAPVPVTVTTVENRSIVPGLFGIGTVEARHSWRIGPTMSGRLLRLDVEVGDRVVAGQVIGGMDPVDLEDRILAQQAAVRRAEANVLSAVAQVEDMLARQAHAQAQVRRYSQLLQASFVSDEALDGKVRENRVAVAGVAAAQANLDALRAEHSRLRADLEGLRRQLGNLQLVAPVDGLVAARLAEPGTTLLAGQGAADLIDPATLWINMRVDQARAEGLRAGLSARVVLRSRPEDSIAGSVLRVEPLADAVTEEQLAKVIFEVPLAVMPPVGELAEVTVDLPALAPSPTLPNAAIRREGGNSGVWVIEGDGLRFVPVVTGASDLDGNVQIVSGVEADDRVVVYSQQALDERSRVRVVERLPGLAS